MQDEKYTGMKPCPFCGSEGIINNGGFGERFVTCKFRGCGAGLGASCWLLTEEQAIDAWNRRHKVLNSSVN